jgi:gliding motility-associated-like protein
MKNIYKCISFLRVSKVCAIALCASLPYYFLAQEAPSIDTSEKFHWSVAQVYRNNAATTETVRIKGDEYDTSAAHKKYEFTTFRSKKNNKNYSQLNIVNPTHKTNSHNWYSNTTNSSKVKALALINIPPDITIECGEDESSANTGEATSDSTCGPVIITQSDVETEGTCGNIKTIVRTWTATDQCGNVTSGNQIITVEDTQPPLLTLPADVTLECNEDSSSASTGLAKGEDNCGGVRISESDEVIERCGNSRIILRTWTVTDNCGNPTSGVQTITVVDTTPPVLSIPSDMIIECNEDESSANTGEATGSDTCGEVTISQSDVETSACGNTKIITRTWTATDECGNITSADQTITVRDTTPPTIDNSAIENINVQCSINNPTLNAWLLNNAGATANDTCGNVSWSNNFDPNADVDCTDGAIVVTFIATDDCGNSASTTATYSIVDEIPPTLTVPADVTIECGEDSLPINTGEASATDDCSALSITYVDSEVAACGNTQIITRTWTATDACGNSTSADQTITVQDTTPPTFTVPADIIIECDVDVTDVSITGDVTDEADNCSSNLNAVFSDSIANGTCPVTAIITRTWSLTDDCNNTTTLAQTITVQDTTPPTFSVPEDITIECDIDITDLSLTGDVTDENDNCSTNLEAVFTDNILDGSCTNSSIITRTWSLTDDCNNTTTFVQTITVQDTTPPTFSVPEDITIECDVDATNLSLTGDVIDEDDNCSTNLEAIFSDSIVDGSCPNTSIIARTWSLTDDCNNNTTFVQTITIQDTTPPIISIPSDIIIECTEDESSINTGEASGIDSCGVVTISQSDVETSACGNTKTIIRTWTATDECGNTTSADQTITVIDTTPPTIDNSAKENISVECGITPDGTLEAWLINNAGATANDSCGNVSWSNDFDATSYVDCTNGEITVTFTATDECGNSVSTTATFSIIDETPPTLILPEDVTIECGEDILPINTGEANANDECSTPAITYSDIEVIACGNTKTITRTWTAEDSCGNTTSADQIITVQDTTPPTFVETLPLDISVECNTVPSPEILTANDNCGSATIIFNEDIITGSCLGNYTLERTWIATDSCGNETSHTQIITVEDNTAPTIVTPFEENITVACDGIPERPDLVFQDSCSNNIAVEFSEVSSQTNEFEDYEIIRTWIVTDDCDNVAEFTQTITVVFNNTISSVDANRCILDSEIDLFDLLSGDFNMNGTWTVVSGNAEINGSLFDPSSVDVGIYTFMYSVTEDSCPAESEVTITINDDCVVLGCGQEDIVIPKTVTANGDGENDVFKITGVEDCDFVIELQLFNRWGAEIYKSSNYQNDWNGDAHRSSVGGSGKVPTGTYYYIINIKDSGLAPFTGPIYVATN